PLSLHDALPISVFHRRPRAPFLPPLSAVSHSALAWGEVTQPIRRHHCRSVATANGAVSWVVPPRTHPVLAVMSSMPYGMPVPVARLGKASASTSSGLPWG